MPSSRQPMSSAAHRPAAPGAPSPRASWSAPPPARRPRGPAAGDGHHAGGEHRRGQHATQQQPGLEQPAIAAPAPPRAGSPGLVHRAPAKPVISEAEVTTQPVPASASSRPKTTSRPSRGLPGRSAVASVGPVGRALSARLTAYSPVATTGATSRKPEKAPASQPELPVRHRHQQDAEDRRWPARAAGLAAGSASGPPAARQPAQWPQQGHRSNTERPRLGERPLITPHHELHGAGRPAGRP
jgi:hypothetical protein